MYISRDWILVGNDILGSCPYPVFPTPNSCFLFEPIPYTFPFSDKTRVCLNPQLTYATSSLISMIKVGLSMNCLYSNPTPSYPSELSPNVNNSPFYEIIAVWASPQSTALICLDESKCNFCGYNIEWLWDGDLPHWPCIFLPHKYTSPFVETIAEWYPPQLIIYG